MNLDLEEPEEEPVYCDGCGYEVSECICDPVESEL